MRSRRKGFAVASLILGLLSLPTLGLLFIGAVASIVLGVVALVKANREPAEYGGQGFAIGGIATSAMSILVMPFVLGIGAAIAIPSLLRARVSANETAAIGDIRRLLSAEEAYKASNNGFYDTPACLGAPSRCIPGYSGSTFLAADLASLSPRSGYSRMFHAGPEPDLAGLQRSQMLTGTVSPSSLTFYAYVATPLQQGRTGVRAFCGDASGRICYTADGSPPEVVDGMCPPDCSLLR